MSAIQPPPKIDLPAIGEDIPLDVGITRVVKSMERLAEWMYATAQWIEQNSTAHTAMEPTSDVKRRLVAP